jgi:hypothetical protein
MLDTNVAEKLSFARYGFDIERIKATIKRDFRVVVSPQTLIELMNGVIGGKTDDHLSADQLRLCTLVGGACTPDILRFPGDFSLRTVLGLQSGVPKFNPADFRLWVRTILLAHSQYELLNGYVRIPHKGGRTFGLDKSAIANQQDEGKRTHQEWLQLAMSRTCSFPSRDEWAKRIGIGLEVDLTEAQYAKLGKQLNAAYEYQRGTFETAAANPQYNVTKHDGDWIDNQQLFYLSDPNIFVLTDEEGIRSKCSNSDQSSRILLLKEV